MNSLHEPFAESRHYILCRKSRQHRVRPLYCRSLTPIRESRPSLRRFEGYFPLLSEARAYQGHLSQEGGKAEWYRDYFRPCAPFFERRDFFITTFQIPNFQFRILNMRCIPLHPLGEISLSQGENITSAKPKYHARQRIN